ncbi:hypothetical protein BOX15_Mlig027394g3 [Macrostomum lignano]|uniref:Uncharacterized protein n=1 Tax=Macrostomum lignano TaxID=282301 RepID=A0A267GNA5_9PLAT|nr:hypothetical protein BOX15_Mlig027394g3 [Macrostomum lignano]
MAPNPNGSNPWDLDRLSATGRQYLLEPQSRSNIVRQLQQRLQQEQQRRCEHQQLLLSSNNIAGQQLQDNEQEQQVKDQQESDEARKADTGAPSTVKTYKTAPTPPTPPPPPPKPTHKISSDEYLLPTTQLKLRAKASKENLVPAYVAMRETEEPAASLTSKIVFDEVKQRHSKLSISDSAMEDNPEAEKLPSRPSSQDVLEELRFKRFNLSDKGESTGIDEFKGSNVRLSTQEIYDEIRACQSDLYRAGEASQDQPNHLSTKEILKESRAASREKHSRSGADRAQPSLQAIDGSLRLNRSKAVELDSDNEDEDIRSSQRRDPRSRTAAGLDKDVHHDRHAKLSYPSGRSIRHIDDEAVDDNGVQQRLAGRARQAAESPVETRRYRGGSGIGGSYRALSPAGESRELDSWNEQSVNRQGGYLTRFIGSPNSLIDSFTSSVSVGRVQQSAATPCLMCLIRCLRSTGLLGSCWRAAISELEEAFALKAVADAVAVGPGEQMPRAQTYQQPYQMAPPWEHDSALTGEVNKWQALEQLCSLQNSIRNCPHSSD